MWFNTIIVSNATLSFNRLASSAIGLRHTHFYLYPVAAHVGQKLFQGFVHLLRVGFQGVSSAAGPAAPDDLPSGSGQPDRMPAGFACCLNYRHLSKSFYAFRIDHGIGSPVRI
jgi:hypothetical protein